ncbi:MAG: ATP-binding cassette domain-containing protein, partial [Betaproteobacteria bacterium]
MLKPSDVIKLTKVKFSYASGAIFDDLSVGFPRGKVTAVMGGSGSGKTTILKLIGGQIKPNSGDVSYGGESINQFS